MRCSSGGCAKTEHCGMEGDGCHGKMMITKKIHKTKMGKGHCSHGEMAGGMCCESDKCKGTGECKGKCDEMKECCMNKEGASGEDSVIIEKKVIIN